MNKHQVDLQIEFVRCELTRICQELLYLEGSQLQSLRVRQSRLAAELERLQALQFSGSFTVVIPNTKDISSASGYHS